MCIMINTSVIYFVVLSWVYSVYNLFSNSFCSILAKSSTCVLRNVFTNVHEYIIMTLLTIKQLSIQMETLSLWLKKNPWKF